MRIIVAGAGPAGLAFALSFKQQRPAATVTIVERRKPRDAYGWGITLPRWALSRLATADSNAAAELAAHSVSWNGVHIYHQGRRVEAAGAALLGIQRSTLLDVLRTRCATAGVDIHYETELGPDALPACDLLVIANGARSAIRDRYGDAFGVQHQAMTTRFTWLATPHSIASLTVAFAETDAGVFIAHGYPSSAEMSTFVVECSPDVWQRTGIGDESNDEACAYLAATFDSVLDGKPLVCHHRVRWTSLLRVRNERWHHERMVLCGDAAHAIHYAVGSGTCLAIEDGLALAAALCQHDDVGAALTSYEEERRAAVGIMQEIEPTVLRRLDRARTDMDLPPLTLAYLLLRQWTANE